MRDVIIAMLPALAISALYFGYQTLIVSCVAIASCQFFEYVIRRFFFGEKSQSFDLSPVVTGLLLAFNLPASIPLWIVVVGSLVSIGIAKMTFGGIGKNPFNPALVGRVFLLIAYPTYMTGAAFAGAEGVVDAFSGATPLEALKSSSAPVEMLLSVDLQSMMMGSIPGSLGEVSALMLILGGLYMLVRRVITWHTPVAVLGSMSVIALLYALLSGFGCVGALYFTAFHLLAGGALLGAIFMATDYTTSPMTHKGALIFGVGIGILTMTIRLWGAFPEGMSFAILIMNSCVPLINKYVKPERFGAKK